MQNFMMVWSRNQDMKSGETCSFLAKEKIETQEPKPLESVQQM